MDELKGLPNCKQLQKDLQKLWKLTKVKRSVDEIEALYYKYAKIFPFLEVNTGQDLLNNLPIYRARKKVDTRKEDLFSIHPFNYPNAKICCENGRANLKGTSVFYCAHSYMTAISETKPVKGDCIFVTKWRANCNRNINILPLFDNKLPKTNPWWAVSQIMIEDLKLINDILYVKKAKQINSISEFISNCFLNESSPYSITSWISNHVLFNKKSADLLIYPSFTRDFQSCNLAIHPQFADQFLKMTKVYLLEIMESKEGLIKFTVNKVAECRDNALFYREPNKYDYEELPNGIPSRNNLQKLFTDIF